MKRPLHIITMLLLVYIPGRGQAYAQTASALDADKALTQFMLQVWRDDQGLPQNTVRAIIQSRDGYLWLGTEEGLARFDGVRFTVYDKSNTPAFNEGEAVESLFEDRAGVLWIGTSSAGLIQYADGTFTRPIGSGFEGKGVSALCEDKDGLLWVATRDAGLFSYRNHRFTRYTTRDGLSSNHVTALYLDKHGRLWIGTQDGLDYFAGQHINHAHSSSDLFVTTLHQDHAGTLWVGTRHGLHRMQDDVLQVYDDAQAWTAGDVRALWEDAGGSLWIGMKGGGLGRLQAGRLETLSTGDGLSHDWVLALYGDREGSLWVGTEGGGLNRLWDDKFSTYTTREGLSSNMAMTIFEDRHGAVWIGTDGGGLNRLKDGVFTTYGRAEGLPSDIVSSVYEDADGTLWVGTLGGGLNRFEDGRFTRYGAANNQLSDAIYALATGTDGSLWIGTDAGLARLRNGHLTTYTNADGLGGDYVAAIHEDAKGTLWIGMLDGGLVRFRDGQFTQYTTENGLASNMVLSLYEDAEGTLWIGTYEGGLSRLRDGVFTTYTSREGLFDDSIYQILEDNRGAFWMSCNKGIFTVNKAVLNAFAEGTSDWITSTAFGKADGLKSNEMTGGIQPAGWKRRDGTLWFPSVQGVAFVDPLHIRRNALPPPVAIEAITVDNEPVEHGANVELSPGKKKITFQYTALSFVASEGIHFQVLLHGYDNAWQDVGTSRTATYTNLAPGTYTFHVKARNNDGVWSEVDASVPFTLRPFFYQTTWFYAFSGLFGFLLMLAAYQGRTRHLRRRKRELEALVEARTRDLLHAKDKIEAQAEALRHLNDSLERKVEEQVHVILRERVAYEEQLLEAKEQAERSLRLKSSILDNMNHEFRTPLTTIQGYAQILSEEVNGELKEFVALIDQGGARLMRTLEAVHQLSRLDAGDLDMDFEPIDLVEEIRAVAQRFHAHADRKGLSLRLEVPADERVEALLNQQAVAHILDYLLDNAIKFTDQGEVVLEAARRDDQVIFSVRDTGIGIDPAFMSHLFDAFTQESTGLTRSHDGIGIGLNVAHRLVDLLEGQIFVESRKGQGSVFTVQFPVITRRARRRPPSIHRRQHAS